MQGMHMISMRSPKQFPEVFIDMGILLSQSEHPALMCPLTPLSPAVSQGIPLFSTKSYEGNKALMTGVTSHWL